MNVNGVPVPGRLSDPKLDLYDQDGKLLDSNDNWRASHEQEIQSTQLAPTDDKESAIVTTLNPGGYTGIISGVNGASGVGLIEVYDLESSNDSQAVNISTRGFVGDGDNVLIGGIIVRGDTPHNVLLRAIGPELTGRGVSGALQDPVLELRDENGALLAINDNWKDTQRTQIEGTGIAPTEDREAAILRVLGPGNYTAVVAGVAGTTGVALVEAYNLGKP